MARNHIDAARRIVREERERMAREADAFETFLSRLDSLAVSEPSTSAPAKIAVRQTAVSKATSSTSGAGTTPAAIKDAYEETVMAVPHYEEDYGDSYDESVATEFGEHLAAALQMEQLPSPAQVQLRQAAQEAVDERRQFIDGLDSETTALEGATADLDALRDELSVISSRPFRECAVDELERLEEDVAHLRVRCESLVSARQEALRKQHRILKLPSDFPHLPMYLYQDLEITYPVLATLATLGREIQDVQQQINPFLPSRKQ